MTMLTDCNAQQTKPIARSVESNLETNGYTFLGQTLLDDNYFEGDIQQAYIIPSPDAAYEQCYEYLPDCNSPFPYDETEPNFDDNNGNNGDEDEEEEENIDVNTESVEESNSIALFFNTKVYKLVFVYCTFHLNAIYLIRLSDINIKSVYKFFGYK